jgi:RecB family exonuclease
MSLLKSTVLPDRPEEKMDLTLSVSKVKTFDSCKAKFRYSYIEKLPKKDWDFHIFGKFLHEVLENFHKKLIKNDTRPLHVIMSECYKSAFANWKEKITSEQVKEFKQILNGYLVKYTKEQSEYQVLSAEENFYIDIDGKILLNGFIDRIQLDKDGILHVSDYKSSKNDRYLKNDFFQLQTYAFVMCLKDPKLRRVRTSYIMLRDNFKSIIKEFTRDEVMKMEDKFVEYANQINTEKLYRASPSPLCAYCDYSNICPSSKEVSLDIKYGEVAW